MLKRILVSRTCELASDFGTLPAFVCKVSHFGVIDIGGQRATDLFNHPGFNEDHFWMSEEFAQHTEGLAAKMAETSNDVIAEVCAPSQLNKWDDLLE